MNWLARAAVAALVALSAWSNASAEAQRAEILWDVWGVPHIYAASDEDLFYALGWASMHNHAQVILRLYGQARGRAAEYWGETWLASDEQVRTLKIPQRAAASLDAQSPAFRRNLEAFVAGVNAFAAAHPDKIGEELARVLPVTALDLLAHQQRSGVLPFALQAMGETASAWSARGSNAWALAPKRTKTGNAMLVMNPHIPWGEAAFGGLFRVFEVDLKAPGIDFYGAVQVGNPVPSGGFNDRLGYTHTVNTLDDTDVYALTLEDGGYRFDDAVAQFDMSDETILIRNADGTQKEKPLHVRWSVHGPVMAEANGKALALRLAGIDQPLQLQQFWDMARARDFAAWKTAVERLQIPKSNLVYADADGHIFYLAGGRIPARDGGDYAFWSGIVPGESAATLWRKTLPMASLPQAADPSSGWIQNANDPPWSITEPPAFAPEQYPAWMSPRSLSFRAQQSLKLVQSRQFNLDTLAAAKLTTRSELADRILDDLLAAVGKSGGERVRRAARVLRAWDRTADAKSRGAVLFFAWADKFLAKPAFAQSWSAANARTTPDGLADPAAAVALLDEAAKDVETAYGKLDIAFGDVYRLRWSHGIDLPANGAPGKYGVFRVTDYRPDPDGKRRAVQGDSFVAVIEFAKPTRARALVSYGNASDAASPHDGDQLKLYSEKRLRPVWRSRAEIDAHLESREILQ